MITAKEKFMLFKQRQNFCSVPWNHLFIYTNGDVSPCVKSSIVIGNIVDTDIRDILKSSKLKELKQSFLQDSRHSNCNKCWRSEHDDFQFVRGMYNERFKSAIVDYADAEEFVLSGLDLHWSSVCNLKCITCWHQSSSSIAKEEGKPVQHVPKESADKLIEFIVERQHTLKEIYMSGGEPTAIDHNYRLLKQLEKRSDLLIRVNSNLTWDKNNKIVQEIAKFPNVLFTISADATGDRFEYMRRGAKWDKFLDNLEYLKTFKNFEIRLNSVFCVMSAMYLKETLDYFTHTHGITNITINDCGMEQAQLECRNLPAEIKDIVKQKLELLLTERSQNPGLCGNVTNCLTHLALETTSNHWGTYLDAKDKLSGKNWYNVFEELS